MSTQVTLPPLGESVAEGTVSRWLKQIGDKIAADEPLLEVSTDKVDTEVPSPVSGVLLQILVQEDETAAVGAVLAVVGDEAGLGAAAAEPTPPEVDAEPAFPAPAGESAATWAEAAAASPAAPPDDASQPVQPPPPAAPRAWAAADEPYATPLVRKLAAEHGVSLAGLTGSGVGGRIRKQDIFAAAAAAAKPVPVPEPVLDPAATFRTPAPVPAAPATPTPAAPVPDAPAPAAATPPADPAAAAPDVPADLAAAAPAPSDLLTAALASPPAVPAGGTTEKLSRLRASTARRMVESLQGSAQLTATVEADLTAVSRLRAQAKAQFEAREGVGLSVLAFIAVATAEALKRYPKLNASIDTEAGLVSYPDGVHLGIAVDTPRGLLVPVVHNAGDLSVGGLAKKIADLATRSHSSQLGPEELAGGTFTITDYGAGGVLFDTPIIQQPQAAILGVGALVKRPVVVQERLGEIIAVRDMVYLSLTYDHRLLDSADAARFLALVKTRLETGDFGAEFGVQD